MTVAASRAISAVAELLVCFAVELQIKLHFIFTPLLHVINFNMQHTRKPIQTKHFKLINSIHDMFQRQENKCKLISIGVNIFGGSYSPSGFSTSWSA